MAFTPDRRTNRSGGARSGRSREPVFRTVEEVDYKEISRLTRCIDERGRILPRRRLGHSAEIQRHVALAVKRARHCAILSYTSSGKAR